MPELQALCKDAIAEEMASRCAFDEAAREANNNINEDDDDGDGDGGDEEYTDEGCR